jgi:hypothetical protein
MNLPQFLYTDVEMLKTVSICLKMRCSLLMFRSIDFRSFVKGRILNYSRGRDRQ